MDRVSVGSLMSAIMIVTKYGNLAYFGKCFYGFSHFLVILIQHFVVHHDAVYHLEQFTLLYIVLWRCRYCSYPPLSMFAYPFTDISLPQQFSGIRQFFADQGIVLVT